MNNTQKKGSKGIEAATLAALAALPIYAAWARGGTVPALQTPFVWISAVMLAILIWGAGTIDGAARRMRRDPILYAGAAFLGLLLMQWWNSGRELVFDEQLWQWVYTPPPRPGLPFSFVRSEAAEMLRWFFPAWLMLLLARAAWVTLSIARKLMGILLLNAALLASFGLIQFASGTTSIFWKEPLDCGFFASFGYSNHAGAYFVLMLAVTLGLLWSSHGPRVRLRSGFGVIALSLCGTLMLAGAILSLSRAAILLSLGLVGLAAVTAVAQKWRGLSRSGRAHLVMLVFAAAAFLVFAAGETGRELVIRQFLPAQELAGEFPVVTRGDSMRLILPAAMRVWKANPWFGIGGWGFSYQLGMEIPPSSWSKIIPGSANIHCDPLQFLVEFGVIGGGLMAVAALALLAPWMKTRRPGAPACLFLAGGPVVLGLYSLIDLPLRSPAILYTCLLVAATAHQLLTNRLQNGVLLPEIERGST